MEYRTLHTVLNRSNHSTKPVKTVHLHLSIIPPSVIGMCSGVFTAPRLLQNYATYFWSNTVSGSTYIYVYFIYNCCRITITVVLTDVTFIQVHQEGILVMTWVRPNDLMQWKNSSLLQAARPEQSNVTWLHLCCLLYFTLQ